MPKANINRITPAAESTPSAPAPARPKSNDLRHGEAVQFILTILCGIATVVTVIGVVMAIWPVPGSYLVSDAALVSATASVAGGPFLAILGAIIATGTGIILSIRAKAAK